MSRKQQRTIFSESFRQEVWSESVAEPAGLYSSSSNAYLSGSFPPETARRTNKKKKKRRKRKGARNFKAKQKLLPPPSDPQHKYFGPTEEDMVVQYQKEKSRKERHKIYNELHPKFLYLATSIIYNFRIPLFFGDEVEAITQDCICAIFEAMDKFDPTKVSKNTGKTSKFYSYASVTVSNHLRQLIKQKKMQLNLQDGICTEIMLNHYDTYGNPRFNVPAYEDPMAEAEEQAVTLDFIEHLREQMPMWEEVLEKENDQKVLTAIIKIFDDIEKFDSLEKKEIFFLVREITGDLKPQQINGSLKNIRRLFNEMRVDYFNGLDIDEEDADIVPEE